MKNILILALLLGCVACSESPTSVGDAIKHDRDLSPIKIGVLLPFAGIPEAAQGGKKGMELAVAEINMAGGVDGRLLELIYRDDKSSPAGAIQAAEDLVLTENVKFLVGALHDHVKLAVSDYAKKAGVLFVCPAGGSDEFITTAKHDLAFRLDFSNYMYVQALVEEAAKLEGTRYAMIAPNYEFGFTFVEDFKRYLKAKRPDVEFVYEIFSPVLKLDAAPTVRAISASNPDVVVSALFQGDQVKFIREGRKIELFKDKDVIGVIAGLPEELAITGNETPEGWISIGYPFNQIDTPEHTAFLTSYREAYATDPRLFSLLGFLSMEILGEALQRADTIEPMSVANAMHQAPFSTVYGEVAFDPDTNQLEKGLWLGKTGFIDDSPTLVDWQYVDGGKFKLPE